MEQNKMNTIFTPIGVLLIIIFLAACSSSSDTPTPQNQATEPAAPQTTVTEPATEPSVTLTANTPVGAQGLCANAYYPVREGATWTYTSTGGPAGEYSFTDTITSVREDGFTLSTQFGDLARNQEWTCTSEGLAALQLGGAPAAMLNAQNIQLSLDVTSSSGVTFPREINAGDQWQQNLDVEGNVTVANEEGEAAGNAQLNFTALGNESVTVPAGTFEALKIQIDTTLNVDVTYEGITLPVAFSGSHTYWFVQDVGWVKATGTGSFLGNSFSETMELLSDSIP